MSSSVSEYENIEITLPVNAAYVSAARLTASSVANRMGFDTDETEDIKAAVSESCTYIIKKLTLDSKNKFKIVFSMKDAILEISFAIRTDSKLEQEEDDMSLLMIKALMDEMHIKYENGETIIKLLKKHILISFD